MSKSLTDRIENLERKLCCKTRYFDTFEDFPEGGKKSTLYVDNSTGSIYIWNGSEYVTADVKVGGSGTTNYIPKWSNALTLTNSQLVDNGTNVGIGTTTPNASLDIKGIGNSYSTSSFRVLNSQNVQLLVSKDDGRLYVGGDTGENSLLTIYKYTGSGITSHLALTSAGDKNFTMFTTATSVNNSIVGTSGKIAWGNTGTLNEQLVLNTQNGNLGIGTDTPTARLEIVSSGGQSLKYDNGSITSSSSLFIDTVSEDITIRPAYTNAIVIKASGNVGIGTTSPQSTMDINGTLTVRSIPSYASTAAASALPSGTVFKVTNGDGTSALHIKD